MQQFVSTAVECDAFLKALAGGVVKHEKAKLRPYVSACTRSAGRRGCRHLY